MNPSEIIQQNKEVYNKICKYFSGTRRFLWDDLTPLIKYIKNKDKVLDLGCGTGRLYQLFEKKQIEYIGMDNSPGQIEIAKLNYPGVDFRIGELVSLPFEDNEFNVVFCIAAFHHLPDEETRKKSLKEMKRVVKSDGLIIMTNWHLDSDWAKNKIKKGDWRIGENERDFFIPWRDSERNILGDRYYHGFTVKELENLFKKEKLEIIENMFTTRDKWNDDKRGGNIVSVVKKNV